MGGIAEGVALEYRHANERDAAVVKLHQPWVADEGPLSANFRRGVGEGLAVTGVAFDDQVTVWWDDDAVLVVRAAPHDHDVASYECPVLVRENFGLAKLRRIDYIRVGGRHGGVLLASRFVANGEEETDDARS